MSDVGCLNLETVRSFIVSRGGKVTNHELVKHFKHVLTHPDTRDEARVKFKEIVNAVATITRDSEGGKQLTLRRKYRSEMSLPIPELNLQYTPVYQSPTTEYPDLSRRASQDSLFSSISFRSPLSSPLSTPGPPLPVTPLVATPLAGGSSFAATPLSSNSPSFSAQPATTSQQLSEPAIADPPPVPPRRRSSDKLIRLDSETQLHNENKENQSLVVVEKPKTEEDGKVSVKERSQKFDRMASEVALHKANLPNKKRSEKAEKDEEDGGVTLFDAKSREWIVRCAQGDYQSLAKMASNNPKLVKFKDPTCTALHWAAKHGNHDIIKLIAGTHGGDVNARTNGGYTPLHIAMQFGNEDVYNLLVRGYGADPNMRDWSGKKPRQYIPSQDTSVSADTFRKIKARKKHAEKDLGFLRIGSLNVRVKKTTEAFSNFLGVGNTEKLHKNWGSADNLPQGDSKKMPPPKFAPIKKRKSKRGREDFVPQRAASLIETSTLPKVASEINPADSDSDTAAGFGSTWQSTV